MPSAIQPKPVVLRRMGPMECMQAASSSMDVYHSTMVSCHYMIPDDLVDQSVEQQLISTWELAVARVVLRHPMLQVGLRKLDSKKPSFVQVDTINLSNHIEWRPIDPDKEDYDAVRKELYTEQLDNKFPFLEIQPPWRMLILRSLKGPTANDMEVIFGFHHCLHDGMGAKTFHEDLVRALNNPDESRADLVRDHKIKPNATTANIPPSQEDALKFTNTLPHAASSIFYELTPPRLLNTLSSSTRAFVQKCKAWPPITPFDLKANKPTRPSRTHYANFSIPPDMLPIILSHCRTHKTTITALLHSLVLISLVQQVPASETGSIIKSGTAIDLRRHVIPHTKSKSHPLSNPSRVVANIVTKMSHTFGDDESEANLLENIRKLTKSDTKSDEEELTKIMWSMATKVRKELQDRLDLGLKNELAGMMKFVGDWQEYLRDAMFKPRTASWMVTNIGVLEGDPEGAGGDGQKNRWHIRKAYFTASAEVAGPGFAVCSVSVRGGELCVEVTWEVGVIEDRVGEAVTAEVERWMRNIGGMV
ncbi:Alcohol acetyltransferase domain containing protein [Rhypophila decipiens]